MRFASMLLGRYSSFVSHHTMVVLAAVIVITIIMMAGASLVGTKFMETRDVIPEDLEVIRAFNILEVQGKTDDEKCLLCHTTGFGRFSGYDPKSEEKGDIYLRGVQCEACHGPGTLHARDGSYVSRAWKSCRSCHTTAWSPDFEERAYWIRAAHCGSQSAEDTSGEHSKQVWNTDE